MVQPQLTDEQYETALRYLIKQLVVRVGWARLRSCGVGGESTLDPDLEAAWQALSLLVGQPPGFAFNSILQDVAATLTEVRGESQLRLIRRSQRAQ